ncbi:MAG: bifunctional UDP-N-acetylglucosamine diphosphorylase/glucosamine-1-phosphate N-acetyltransferase GlmU [Holosporaceae bacterium]|jgi:bifunctional UDP-N-acetylglucosamine pyrophosphorylase/glucosamine-1-phosphate N-acetyltransferase|nr:bifunctional UDP-N-acetylglucosamine diphosphorylase/glucosamine-1-phosphate N-acetyltransferase GlmU [Holosporaceae bacterium]
MFSSAIILAAGVGSRLKSNTPKVYHKVGGLSLVDHIIMTARSVNLREITVVLNPKYQNIRLKFDADIIKAHQEILKGTADAVKCGLNVMSIDTDSWIYVLYGDIPLITAETLLKMAEVAHKCERTAVVVLAMDATGTNGLGRLEPADQEGTIAGIIEAKDISNCAKTLPLCNAGMLIRGDILKKFINEIKPSAITGEFYITEIVRLAYESGYICRYYECDSRELAGVNTRAELALLEKNFQERERKKHLDNGVTLVAPETTFFSYDTHLENDVTVYPYVVFLEGVHVGSGAHIGPFCVVEGSKIGSAKVGPFSRLRTGADILDGVKIGNFVEVKNSVISENTKINHLSYVGDSTVGKNTNIGAGTITCNYDGFKKHKTIIGENVFVGSNTALIAPVEVCDNATVGAGSVIVQNVADGELAIARSDQKNISDWYKKFRRNKKCAE